MEQIIKMAQEVYERRNLKSKQIAEIKEDEVKAKNNRIEEEAKEIVKLIIQLFDASNQEDGDYRIDDIRIEESDKNGNLFCMVTFEKDKNKTQTFIGYYELINLPYISKAIDVINHQKFDPEVLYKVMDIIPKLEDYTIHNWSAGKYKSQDRCAESLMVGI